MGLEVAVADYNPDAVGIPFADRYFNASTIDIDAIVRVAREYRPDGIMTLATDMPMRSIAAATQSLGLPGISMESAVKSTDKIEMIKAFKEHGVASPWFFEVASSEELEEVRDKIIVPCIMKPADNSGSRGVTIINSLVKLEAAYKYSVEQSRNGKVIIEEYLQGDEVSVEVITYGGEPHVLQVTDKLTTGVPYFVEMGHSQPSKFIGEDLDKISELAKAAVKAVGIRNSPAHVEMMVTNDGPKMIELGARMGGDCITTHLVPLSTGIDMIKAAIDISLGRVPDLEKKWDKGSAIRYFDVEPGIIQSISGVDEVEKQEGVQEIILTKSIGEEVTPIHSSLDRVGMIVCQADSNVAAMQECEKALAKVHFTTSPYFGKE
ncbi:MAG: ATP-grasp domain-containing protein [Bacteroides sp.]|nr:ATP-grasp domain-containing protein [Bacteroides sp.]